jgi:uncharacterized protein
MALVNIIRWNMKKSNKLNALTLRRKMQWAMSKSMEKIGRNGFKPKDFEIVNVRVTIPRLDPAFYGYRMVQLTDIHLGQWLSAERFKGVIEMVNQEEPDLVAITGDFVSYELDQVAQDLVDSLCKLKPQDVSVSVLGNHDHWLGADKIRRILHQCNIIDLSNNVYTLYRNGAMLHIAGVDSVMLNKHRLDVVIEMLPSIGPAILLSHEPDFADISATTGRFSLQLSGHSHGGQFVIPGIGTFIRGPHFLKYPLGRYEIGDMVQYTSRGLGTNVFWFRVNCPPEITVFTLEGE